MSTTSSQPTPARFSVVPHAIEGARVGGRQVGLALAQTDHDARQIDGVAGYDRVGEAPFLPDFQRGRIGRHDHGRILPGTRDGGRGRGDEEQSG
jgi:hypothetical protein